MIRPNAYFYNDFLKWTNEWFENVPISQDDLLRAAEEALVLSKQRALATYLSNFDYEIDYSNLNNLCSSTYLEADIKRVMKRSFPDIVKKKSNHNKDADIPFIGNLEDYGLELKVRNAPSSDREIWTFGKRKHPDERKDHEKRFFNYHIFIKIGRPNNSIQELNEIINGFSIEKMYFVCLVEDDITHNFAKKDFPPYYLELK